MSTTLKELFVTIGATIASVLMILLGAVVIAVIMSQVDMRP